MERDALGRYQIKDRLGKGGMGVVYLAFDPAMQRDVAIKMLRADVSEDPAFLERFRLEATTIAALDHPSIVPVHDVGEEDGIPYFVMRYMRGGSLAHLLRKEGALSAVEVLRILRPIADALDESHAHGIIHRDVKPGNILFDQRGDSFIADFGLVKSLDAPSESTASGVVGTAEYISPEMAVSGHTTPLSDIYSLGITIFEMLAGKVPYEGVTHISTVLAHVHDPIPEIRSIQENLPPGIQAVIDRALAKRPEDRYPTAGALIKELNDALTGDYVPPIPRSANHREGSGTKVLTRQEQKQLHERVKHMPLASRVSDTSSGRPTLASAAARPPRKKRRGRPVLAAFMVLLEVSGLLVASYFQVPETVRLLLYHYFPTLESTIARLLSL